MRGKLENLPKWARQEIDRLERDLAYNKAKLAEGPEDSDTFADEYSDAPRPLGRGPTITFKWGGKWGEKIEARLDGETLIVRGGTQIDVHPVAGNVVEIMVRS